jgi:hypothetical protein
LTEEDDSASNGASGQTPLEVVVEALREMTRVRLGALRDGAETWPEDDTAIAAINALYEESDGDWSICAQAIDDAGADWIYPVMLARAVVMLQPTLEG